MSKSHLYASTPAIRSILRNRQWGSTFPPERGGAGRHTFQAMCLTASALSDILCQELGHAVCLLNSQPEGNHARLSRHDHTPESSFVAYLEVPAQLLPAQYAFTVKRAMNRASQGGGVNPSSAAGEALINGSLEGEGGAPL